MKTINTVQTEQKAIELIADKVGKSFDAFNLENKSCQCECGETQAVKYADYESDEFLMVGICESCGDDDAFIDEVVY